MYQTVCGPVQTICLVPPHALLHARIFRTHTFLEFVEKNGPIAVTACQALEPRSCPTLWLPTTYECTLGACAYFHLGSRSKVPTLNRTEVDSVGSQRTTVVQTMSLPPTADLRCNNKATLDVNSPRYPRGFVVVFLFQRYEIFSHGSNSSIYNPWRCHPPDCCTISYAFPLLT